MRLVPALAVFISGFTGETALAQTEMSTASLF